MQKKEFQNRFEGRTGTIGRDGVLGIVSKVSKPIFKIDTDYDQDLKLPEVSN